jgi:triacylglycerol lipase
MEQLYGCSMFFYIVRRHPDMESTKYPVVLVHGMMDKDFSFWPAFRGITDFLRKQNVTVYTSDQDCLGIIANNAAQLKEEILSILEKEGCEKVNLIAHSKGGLDARYMISRLDMGAHVASLTTLSTPHHGSGLSAKLLKMPLFLSKTIAFFTNTFYRLLGDAHPDILQLGRELTAPAMENFNETVPNIPNVYYQSFSSTAPHKKAFLRFIPYQISRYCEQDDTDGMVAVKSSQWGNYRGSMSAELDHFKMVGVYGRKKKLTGVGLFYLHIIQELRSMGF